jgi:hypothetical protein
VRFADSIQNNYAALVVVMKMESGGMKMGALASSVVFAASLPRSLFHTPRRSIALGKDAERSTQDACAPESARVGRIT